MSCAISVSSCIADIKRVTSHLNQSCLSRRSPVKDLPREETTGEGDSGAENNTGWEWTDIADEKLADVWLSDECCVSLSPSKDILAIGYEDRVVFLERKWDSKSESDCRVKYEILWCGSLELEPGECVTSLLCLPLASQHRSSPGAVDWTCIIAGFTSGYLRIYMHNGTLLLSQFLHDDPVIKLKCVTHTPFSLQASAETVEELAILYPNALVLIDGFSLYQSLRACRNQIARAHASGSQEIIQPPPLAYKKWRFKGQNIITDLALCGTVTQCLFEQLQTASFLGGVNAGLLPTPAARIQFITTGSEPFVGVYTVSDGSAPPLISDVALAVASKLTSAVWSRISAASGWLGWGGKQPEIPQQDKAKVKPKVEKGTRLDIRYGLPDDRRHGVSIEPAPTGKVAAITDDFGRVKLIDLRTGVVKRIWKGYRDAQCGWIVSEEEHGNAHAAVKEDGIGGDHVSRRAMFLVIYAPKRGIIEIWAMEQGPRVSAFNVGKDCRLLTCSYGILGLSHIMKQGQTTPVDLFQCLLLQADGFIKEVAVPFHCVLSDKHSKRVRDLHLLTQLSSILDEVKLDKEIAVRSYEKLEKTILDILVDIQIPHFHQQALQCILSTFGVPSSLLVKCVETVQELVAKRSRMADDQVDKAEVSTIFHFCDVQLQLLRTHASINDLHRALDNSTSEGSVSQEQIGDCLNISSSEVAELTNELQKYWTLMSSLAESNVSSGFAPMTVTAFLSCFEAPSLSGVSQGEETSSRPRSRSSPCTSDSDSVRSVRLRALSTDTEQRLAKFLFPGLLTGDCLVEQLNMALESSGIRPKELLDLLLTLWLSNETVELNGVLSLHSMLSRIHNMKGAVEEESMTSSDDDVCPWWTSVRRRLAESTHNDMAITAAYVGRSVAMASSIASRKMQTEEKETAAQELTTGDWVSISVEMECWNLLVYRLHDVLALKSFLVSSYKQNRPLKARNKKVARPEREDIPKITVLELVTSGKGTITQLIAEWISKMHVIPELLGTRRKRVPIKSSHPEEHDKDRPEIESMEEDDEEEEEHMELEGLSELRKRFPYSLEQDCLWVQCAWEFSQRWLQEIQTIEYLGWSIRTIKCIHSPVLRQGILHILWERLFKERISITLELMKKVGKAPKERLCVKSVGLPYVILQQFLRAARDLLLLMIENAEEEGDSPEILTEDFWRHEDSDSSSLAEEAAEQPLLNLELIQHHVTFITVMWVIMGLAMKSVKPVDLFDNKSRSAFLKDLFSKPPLPTEQAACSIQDARRKFFDRALTNLVSQMMFEASPEVSALKTVSEVRDWAAVLFEIAEEFDVDKDILRRHLVHQLYSAGQDTFAREELISVKDKPAVAHSLFEIVGQRLCQSLVHNPDGGQSVHLLSHFPTSICAWIKSQDPSKLLVRDVPVQSTVDLLTFVVSHLPKTHSDYDFASELAEAVEFLL